ncbi:hypothetical protein PRIC2_011223 [Phytophthora ramorum]
MLLGRGAATDKALPSGFDDLLVASENGQLDVIRLLLDNGASINTAANEGGSPLFVAAGQGHTEVVKLLIERGAASALTNNAGWSALMKASELGYPAIVKELLRSEAGPEMIDLQLPSGATALNIACEHGQFDVVRRLVNNGAALELADKEGYTPLITAAQLGYSDIVQLLVNRGARMDARLPSGGTALLTAVWHKRLAVVRILLDNGADINLCGDFQSWTPLDVAYFSGYTELVQLIFERVPADKKLSFFDLVSAVTSTRAAKRSSHKAKPHGVIDQKHRNGDTALRIACERGQLKAVENLLENPNSDVNVADAEGWTPLISASSRGHVDVVSALLKMGAQHSKILPNGCNALHIACEEGHYDVVKELLQHGAAIDSVDNDGERGIY